MEGEANDVEMVAVQTGKLTLESEVGVERSKKQNEYVTTSAHAVGTDSWPQVGILLVTSFNCAYVLSFSNLMLVPLGWAWGLTCLGVIGAFTIYANWLLAGFHVIDGQRFIRYRDIMGYLFGTLFSIILLYCDKYGRYGEESTKHAAHNIK